MSLVKKSWPSMEIKEVENSLGTDLTYGLPLSEVLNRRGKYGKNVFKKPERDTVWAKILKQIKSPLALILVIAGLITLFLGEFVDTLVIFIAVSINITIGIIQEGRASKAFKKLNESQKHFSSVVRDGKKSLIPIEELVRGDVVLIDAGDYVPADLRLIETSNLEVNESALTGEWVSVPKDSSVIKENQPLSEQSNMAFMGTLVSSGSAKGVVVGTGSQTEIGAIAESLSSGKEVVTPIQKSIKKLAKFLALITTLIVVLIFALGVFKGEAFGEMLLISVAVAVAVIPEGLPAAVTVVLVVGMERILNKGGLVRNLLAAETLGSTTVILTDKTGTLTKGIMKLSSIYTLSTLLELDTADRDNTSLLKMAVLASDAYVEEDDEKSEMVVRGRPLEKAILLAGLESGLNYNSLKEDNKRIDFLPFDSEHGFLASLNYDGSNLDPGKDRVIYFNGSPEKILERSKYVHKNGKHIVMTKDVRESFERVQEKWSRQGMRFLGLAHKSTKLKALPKAGVEKESEYEDLVFMGFMAFEDDVREDVPRSINTAKEAGARVIMITGDNRYTAHKIARDVGIATAADKVLEGKDIEGVSDKDLLEVLHKVKVFARVLPSEKLRISNVLQGAGEVVAMTGDGVNDAPALKGANIGVAVGSGTEVAKESSDLILINNSFSVIVSAIEEGRRIMDNLRKIVSFLLSTGFGEIFVISSALLLGLPLPILPAQILWINIVGEGAMNFAFAFEPKERDLMQRDPKTLSSKNLLTSEIRKIIFIIGITTGLLAVLIYLFLLRSGLPIDEVRTVVFSVLALSPIFFAFSFKSLHEPIWKINPFSNKYLILSVLISLGLLAMALSLETLRDILRLTQLSLSDFSFLLVIGIFNLFLIEVTKFFLFRGQKYR